MRPYKAGPPQGPPILLIHGATSNARDMLVALGPDLARRHRVIIPDRPGHGWSSRPGGRADASPARQAALIVEALDRLGELVPQFQPAEGVTYAEKIDKAEARVDWTRPAADVDRQIRGLSPFPGAWCEIGGERLKLLRSRLAGGHGAPGQLLGGFTVACGSGAVEILEAQRQGKRPMPADEILRGLTLPDRLA